MKLDRALQRQILEDLAEAFPSSMDIHLYREKYLPLGDPIFAANVIYLEMHGLMTGGAISHMLSGEFMINLSMVKISHKGLDFVQDDGGLGAILGVTTVRLHADTIRDLIEMKVAESDASPEEKKRFIDHLRALPSEGLKHLTTRLVDLALDSAPSALPLLQKLLSP
ncbi:hypothetical protein [Laribacter hongkongensis]|uniref:hypothetical protein n=1 Tax=Laribacter hongkongensis TaxID=168471 RepID=UPI001EFD3F60|nr:hypothetical protein [Laribacter hongkongensis]MCG9081142.1 hypothetical protein [Laribacter hongkongensis]